MTSSSKYRASISSPYWGQEYAFSQAHVCIRLPESSVLVPSTALLLSSLTVTIGYITDHVMKPNVCVWVCLCVCVSVYVCV